MAFSHMNSSNQLASNWLATLDWVVHAAVSNHLTVIVDEHDYGPMGSNLTNNQPRLLAFWRQVGERYHNEGSNVASNCSTSPMAS